MNKEERELFDEKIKGIYAAIDSNANINNEHFKNITDVLSRIEKQTTKTNSKVTNNEGRIHQLELDDRNHLLNCPQKDKIDKINKDLETLRVFEKYPKIFVVGIVVIGIFTVLSGLSMAGIF